MLRKVKMMCKLWIRLLLIPVIASVLSGCALSPSIPVFGAAFPGWLFCLIGAALLLGLFHWLVARKQWQECLSPLIISYPGLLFLFAVILWFILFAN